MRYHGGGRWAPRIEARVRVMVEVERRYAQADFEGEKPVCDIVMKGGITSGVV